MKATEEQILANIIAIRNKKGFSQDYMASKIGLKQSGYGLIERGERRLQVATLIQIALAFDMHIVDIILYPNTFVSSADDDIKASLTVELRKDKKDQVLKLVFGDHNLEILNK